MSVSIETYEDRKVVDLVRRLAIEDYKGPGKLEFESREKYKWLKQLGSSLWLDTGDLAAARQVWSSEIEALTTNNTLVNQVVQTGKMDGLISYATKEIRKACPGISDQEMVVEIAFLVNARLALSLVEELGARVSVELHPDSSGDVHRTLAYARRYYEINPDFFYVKVPLTPDGFIAVRQLSAEGIPINYTLGFSARQNYLAARFSHPRFVNVFLGRLNQLVEENGVGRPENIGEKAALASYETVRSLRELKSGISTLQIAASMRNGKQVADLAGIDVLTIPPKVAGDYLEMDITRESLRPLRSDDLTVTLDTGRAVEASAIHRLWEIDEQFIAFVEDAVKQADQLVEGRDLVQLSAKHGVNLFHEWTKEDRRIIRQKGKIPDLSQWPGAPVDDLMSISALEAFAKDQTELDDRIAGLAAAG
ncbi:MAG: transaldolase family protein [Armatimonadota bacterium]|nr:transaldolase family protein [Armatimonadota bacterium]